MILHFGGECLNVGRRNVLVGVPLDCNGVARVTEV